MKLIKVAWICHFSNSEIRKIVPLTKKIKYIDFANWITNLIKGFEKREDVELHIISPHKGLNSITFSFKKNNINYHFFKPDLPIIHRNWPFFFPIHRWTKFLKNRILIKMFLRTIKPDIVNVHGTENIYYSISILDIKNIPVYVCIQGIYSNPERFYYKYVRCDKLRMKVEKRIISKTKYFGLLAPYLLKLINQYNSNPIFLLNLYPVMKPISEMLVHTSKIFDFVYFARIVPTKGIEDLIDAIKLIKKEITNITVNIIGMGTKEYIDFLKWKIKILNLEDNVIFTGVLPTITDVHNEALKAKFYVLPTKLEHHCFAILEAILLDLPVVSCNVGGIPFLNKDGQCVLLSEPGDVETLKTNMLKLLKFNKLAEKLRYKSKAFVEKEFNYKVITDRYIMQYHAIIKNFKFSNEISEDLLFKEESYK